MPGQMSDAEIQRRKKLQGKVAVTTSTLGLGALALKGGGALAPKASRFTKVNPAKLAHWGGKMDRAATNTSIAAGGVGGLGGYNFAAYTKAEARKKQETLAKNHGGLMDFGLGSVHQGESEEISKLKLPGSFGDAAKATVKGKVIPHKPDFTAAPSGTKMLGAGSAGPSAAAAPKKGWLTPMKIGVGVGGTTAVGAGAYGVHRARKVEKRDDSWMNISEHERHAKDGRATRRKGRSVSEAGLTIGGAAVGHSIYGQTKRPDAFTQAGALGRRTRVIGDNVKIGAIKPKTGFKALGGAIKANPHGAALIGGGALMAAGIPAQVAGSVKNRHHENAITGLRRQRAGVAKRDQQEKGEPGAARDVAGAAASGALTGTWIGHRIGAEVGHHDVGDIQAGKRTVATKLTQQFGVPKSFGRARDYRKLMNHPDLVPGVRAYGRGGKIGAAAGAAIAGGSQIHHEMESKRKYEEKQARVQARAARQQAPVAKGFKLPKMPKMPKVPTPGFMKTSTTATAGAKDATGGFVHTTQARPDNPLWNSRKIHQSHYVNMKTGTTSSGDATMTRGTPTKKGIYVGAGVGATGLVGLGAADTHYEKKRRMAAAGVSKAWFPRADEVSKLGGPKVNVRYANQLDVDNKNHSTKSHEPTDMYAGYRGKSLILRRPKYNASMENPKALHGAAVRVNKDPQRHTTYLHVQRGRVLGANARNVHNAYQSSASSVDVNGKKYAFHREDEPVKKAYDPEANRHKRLDHYATGLSMASGAAGTGAVALGAKHVGRPSKAAGHKWEYDMGTKTNIRRTVPGRAGTGLFSPHGKVVRSSAKGVGGALALGAGAAGLAVGSSKVRGYKQGRGASYKPRVNTGI